MKLVKNTSILVLILVVIFFLLTGVLYLVLQRSPSQENLPALNSVELLDAGDDPKKGTSVGNPPFLKNEINK